jgi:hypothetical protein
MFVIRLISVLLIAIAVALFGSNAVHINHLES